MNEPSFVLPAHYQPGRYRNEFLVDGILDFLQDDVYPNKVVFLVFLDSKVEEIVKSRRKHHKILHRLLTATDRAFSKFEKLNYEKLTEG